MVAGLASGAARGDGSGSPMLAVLTVSELWPILADALPVIVSLIIIEGLLSVDNALAIAAMASHLPGKQKQLALKVGILGAYLFRGLALLLASYIIANPWLKLAGAAYLIHLMAHHFAARHPAMDEDPSFGKALKKGFWATVVSIELMDLSLGVDNVVAAVALSDKMWVVCTGVFIGILALRFVAGRCIKLIERFPVLEHTAFLLIGYVGLLLVVEIAAHVDIPTWVKFAGIASIIAVSIWYAKKPGVQAALRPLFRATHLPLRWYDLALGAVFAVILAPFRLLRKSSDTPDPTEEVEHALEILEQADRSEHAGESTANRG
jgi:tellurite resistance protein TerC